MGCRGRGFVSLPGTHQGSEGKHRFSSIYSNVAQNRARINTITGGIGNGSENNENESGSGKLPLLENIGNREYSSILRAERRDAIISETRFGI